MKITEVRIFPKEGSDKKLRAFAAIALDGCFIVRDIKIIEGNKGLFVAMPSRKERTPCPQCGHRNVLRTNYCNQCGGKLDPVRGQEKHETGDHPEVKQSEYKDIAHPITVECREYIQKTVLEAYQQQKNVKS